MRTAWRADQRRHDRQAARRHRHPRATHTVLRDGRQARDDTGAAALPSGLPKAGWLLADRGHEADRFREALQNKGIRPCIPGRTSPGKPVTHDKRRTRRRNRIEIMFGKLKDRRPVATRSDRRPKAFLPAIARAETLMSSHESNGAGA